MAKMITNSSPPIKGWSLFLYFLKLGWPCDMFWPMWHICKMIQAEACIVLVHWGLLYLFALGNTATATTWTSLKWSAGHWERHMAQVPCNPSYSQITIRHVSEVINCQLEQEWAQPRPAEEPHSWSRWTQIARLLSHELNKRLLF